MKYDDIISKVSEESGIPKTRVDMIYKAYWRAVREHIVSLPLKENLSDEEFLKLQPNVNIPSIGKFCITLDRYKHMKDSYNNNNKTR